MKTSKSKDMALKLRTAVLSLGVLTGIVLVALAPSKGTFATGSGSSGDCSSPTATVDGNDDTLSYNASSGQTITGVCIKSGSNMFGGNEHSGVLGNGTVESCYTVSGVGTGSVTVTRTGTPSDSCQGLSHIDVITSSESPSPSPTPTATPTESPTPTPTATPTATPTETPTPTPAAAGAAATSTPTPAVLGAAAESTPTPTPTPAGAVLGVSAELPETGAQTFWIFTSLLTLLSGGGLIAASFKK